MFLIYPISAVLLTKDMSTLLMSALSYSYIYVYAFCGTCMAYDTEEFSLKMLKKSSDVGQI